MWHPIIDYMNMTGEYAPKNDEIIVISDNE